MFFFKVWQKQTFISKSTENVPQLQNAYGIKKYKKYLIQSFFKATETY